MSISPQPTDYLSLTSANALISDINPASIAPIALTAINTLLDELLIHLLSAAQSINPLDLRREAIPAFFTGGNGSGESTGVRALGRGAVAEAEVELRGWLEGRAPSRGFPPGGKGQGTNSERDFPLLQAVELMRVKCASLSTLAPPDAADPAHEDQAVNNWRDVGGDSSEDTIEPAGLWLTAIVEHVCERILSQVSRVVSRDSSNDIAGPQELYTALCEDESVWGFFKKMKVKEDLEAVIQSTTRQKRSTPSRSSPSSTRQGRASPAMSASSAAASRISLPRDFSIDAPRSRTGSAVDSRGETNYLGGIAGGIIRKGSTLSRRNHHSGSPASKVLQMNQHERSGSVLSVNTRSMLGAYNESFDEEGQSPEAEEDIEAQEEFDSLVRSGETLKVSLTPNRLKNPDAKIKSQAHASPTDAIKSTSVKGDHGRRTHSISRVPVPPLRPSPKSTPDAVAENVSPTRTSPSVVLPTSYTRPSHKKRRGSDQKLVARAAKVIEEEEDDSPKLLHSKKESLFDILANESAFSGQEEATYPARRTVPAVVLGTPPPPAPQSAIPKPSPPESKRKAAPAPITVAARASKVPVPQPPRPAVRSEDKNATEVRKKKTEAQELADFFNSEPPENTLTVHSQDQGEETPVTASKSRFRGFMNKVTGGKRALSVSVNSPLESTSLSRLNSLNSSTEVQPIGKGTGPTAWDMRRPKSMQSIGVHPSNQYSEPPVPPVPTHHSKPSMSTTNVQPVPLKKPTSSPPRPEPVPVPEAVVIPPPAPKERKILQKPSIVSLRKRPSPSRVGTSTSTESTTVDDVAAATAAIAGVAAWDQTPNQSPSAKGRKRSGTVAQEKPLVIQKTVSSTTDSTFATVNRTVRSVAPPPGPAVVTATIEGMEAESFKSAEEASAKETEIPTRAEETVMGLTSDVAKSGNDPTEETRGASPEQSASTHPADDIQSPQEPTIALKDLVPLRRILEHATSAGECRLLLNAILTQIGVPQPQREGTEEGSIDTPEGRVLAWLLAGKEGPVGDYGVHTVSLRKNVAEQVGVKSGESTEDDQLVTPARTDAASVISRAASDLAPTVVATKYITEGDTNILESDVESVKLEGEQDFVVEIGTNVIV